MTGEDRPPSSEELIRRARDEVQRGAAPSAAQGTDARDHETRPDPSDRLRRDEYPGREDAPGRDDGAVEHSPGQATAEAWRRSRDEADDGDASGERPPPPDETREPAAREPAARQWPTRDASDDDSTWLPDGPGVPQEAPGEPKPGIWVKLLVYRGWIVGAVAGIFLFTQCVGNGTTLDDLDVGDCFQEPGVDVEVSAVATLDCNELHDYELYAFVDLGADGRPYPGDDPVSDEVSLQCYEEFARYVGTDWGDSDYDFVWYVPTAESWDDGVRDGICAIFEYDPRTYELVRSIGTARNSGR